MFHYLPTHALLSSCGGCVHGLDFTLVRIHLAKGPKAEKDAFTTKTDECDLWNAEPINIQSVNILRWRVRLGKGKMGDQ